LRPRRTSNQWPPGTRQRKWPPAEERPCIRPKCVQVHSLRQYTTLDIDCDQCTRHLVGVDIGAEQVLAEDGEDTALGLLADGGADVDEVGVISGCDWGCGSLLADGTGRGKRRRTGSAVQVDQVQDVGCAALSRGARADRELALSEVVGRVGKGHGGEGSGDEVGVHFGGLELEVMESFGS